MSKAKIALALLALFLLLAFGWFVWPTRYEYLVGTFGGGNTPAIYRVDRITGRVWRHRAWMGWLEAAAD